MNDEMEQKNQNTNVEPWSRNFDEEDGGKNRQFSRTARNTNRQTVTPLSRVLLVVFFAIVIIPSAFIVYYYATRTQNNEPKTAEQIMVTKSSSESSVVSTSESQSATSSSEVIESSSVASSNETTISQETYSEPASVVSSSSTTGEYTIYTVQAGDNLYRIALNHGMDLDTLKELNGITGDSISVGTQLKVYAQ